VKPEFATQHLRCPACRRDRTLVLDAMASDELEVREGTLRCASCGTEHPVHRGVAHLMPDPPEHVAREAAGLERFAEFMRNTGWDEEAIRRLPNNELGYWYAQARSMDQLVQSQSFSPGEWLLDVGSNTCWASNRLAREGLNVIALDISTVELQGLYTSDIFISDGTSYFERVLASMNDMPIASGSLDYVFCCEVLHHNDIDGLRRTMREIFRVLKPGGKLLVVNETLKTLRDPVGVHTEGVEEFEGHEHAHWALRYRAEAVLAGFSTRIVAPQYFWFFDARPPGGVARTFARSFRWERGSLPIRARRAAVAAARASRVARRAYLAWLNHVAGGVQLSMVATKPSRVSARATLRGFRGSLRPAARPG
jgi:SAM-dependent methyltransferase/uncharacterized protein YbaR (Trm112 family)